MQVSEAVISHVVALPATADRARHLFYPAIVIFIAERDARGRAAGHAPVVGVVACGGRITFGVSDTAGLACYCVDGVGIGVGRGVAARVGLGQQTVNSWDNPTPLWFHE